MTWKVLSGNEGLNLWERWFCDSKNTWDRQQLCHLLFEIVMNRSLIWLRISTTLFLYGKNCSSDRVWMKYSIRCGTPPLLGGDEKKWWHLWNLAVQPKGVCFSSCSCGGCWEESGGRCDFKTESLTSLCLVRGFRGSWLFTRDPSIWCVLWRPRL